MLAAQNGHDPCAQALLKARANPNVTAIDPDEGGGWTALLAACYSGHATCVSLLVDAKVTVDHAADDGRTGLITACQNGHLEVFRHTLTQCQHLS